MIAAATFLVILLVIGFLWDRRESYWVNELEDHAAEIAELNLRNKVLTTRLRSAEADAAQVDRLLDELRGDIADAIRAEEERDARLYWLPTLEGVRAASRDQDPVALADDFRRDFEGAKVLPLRGRA